MKIKLDLNSITFRLWEYFIIFAVIILGLVWILQIFFLDTFYESMKLKESNQIAGELMQDFNDSNSISEFAVKINETIKDTDTYVLVETGDGRLLLSPEIYGDQLYIYESSTAYLRHKLLENDLPTYSEITEGQRGIEILHYACYLDKPETGPEASIISNSIIMYMFSPLYPVRSTISILRYQLIYITIIALLLAFSLAVYLSTHISRPIKTITNSAAEMGKGNYGIKFEGGSYSEINELADTLTDTSIELEKTNMYQKDLIANVSHDLKTPLTMIRSYAEMINDLSGDDPEKRRQHLDVIMEEADRLNVLVDDMLSMSKMQNKTLELSLSTFDLCSTISTILTSYDILSEQEGYEFIFNRPDSAIVSGDESKIQQVISNLLTNAIKYCGDDKEIIVNLKKSGRKIRCEVTDHGPGIPEDELTHVWERYYKSSAHHVRPIEGSGLGLSIVKEILTLHKADYGVESELGKGSTFWFEMDTIKQSRR